MITTWITNMPILTYIQMDYVRGNKNIPECNVDPVPYDIRDVMQWVNLSSILMDKGMSVPFGGMPDSAKERYYGNQITEIFSEVKKFPCASPVFDHMMMEFVLDRIGRVGVMIHRHSEVKAVAEIICWVKANDYPVEAGFISIDFDDMGCVQDLQFYEDPDVEITGTPGDLRMGEAFAASCLFYALFACSLLHCKNVVEHVNYPTRQQSRARERKELPPFTWRTIVVNPLKPKKVSDAASSGSGAPRTKRMHLVRGHWAEYGPTYGKGLLFGKLEGRYFIPPVVKGTIPTEVRTKYVLDKKPKEVQA